VSRGEVAPQANRWLKVLSLLGVVGVPARQGLPNDEHPEQAEHGDGQAVLS